MAGRERPTLLDVEVVPFSHQGKSYLRLMNRHGLCDQFIGLPASYGLVVQFFDGRHDWNEIKTKVAELANVDVDDAFLGHLIEQLDQVYLLDTDRFWERKREVERSFLEAPVRPASHAGAAYDDEPDRLRQDLAKLFEHPRGSGLPERVAAGDNGLRGILSPHIDYTRGGPTFTWGFKELVEQSAARVFVIIGTSHYSRERFSLTTKDFATPLGVAANHREYTRALGAAYGPDAFRDELAHKPEHSIELQILFLQHLLDGQRDFRIVPLLVGSFQDAVESGMEPVEIEDIGRMVTALRQVEADSGEAVCYIASGDLAHIGTKFGDPWRVDAERGALCRDADRQLLAAMETGRPRALFTSIVQESDRRRICGFPPVYTMLQAMRPKFGRLLQYEQYLDPAGAEIVSFASMAFHD